MQGWIYGQLLALKDVDSVHSLLQIRLGGVYTLRLANVHHKRCVVWIGLCSVFTPPPPGGTAVAVPPPFRPSDPAICGSCPLVTPY